MALRIDLDGYERVLAIDGDKITIPTPSGEAQIVVSALTCFTISGEGVHLGTADGWHTLSSESFPAGSLDTFLAAMNATLTAYLPPEARAKLEAQSEAYEQKPHAGTPVTWLYVALCVAVTLPFLATSSASSLDHQLRWGAITRTLIDHGQLQRLFSAGFLHNSLTHLVFNTIALGGFRGVERRLGSAAFAAILVTGTVAGNVAVVLFTPNVVAAGLSTGLYGLMGTILVLRLAPRRVPTMGLVMSTSSIVGLLVLNGALSFLPGVSLVGHLGGLVGGVLAAVVVLRAGSPSRAVERYGRIAAALSVLALALQVVRPWVSAGTAARDEAIVSESPLLANAIAWHIAIDHAATPADLERADQLATTAYHRARVSEIGDTLATIACRRGQLDRAILLEREVVASAPTALYRSTLERFLKRAGPPPHPDVPCAAP